MSFGLGFLAGAGAGYQGYKAEERRTDDDARRKKADQRAEEESKYREEERGRQRITWSEADRIKAADKADLTAVNAEFAISDKVDTSAADQAVAQAAVADDQMHQDIAKVLDAPADSLPAPVAPKSLAANPDAVTYKAAPTNTSPKLAPEVVAKLAAGGLTRQPVDFNNTLDRQSALLRRKIDRGDMTTADYTQQMTALNQWRNEGVNDAMAMLSQGRYDEAMQRYNSVGSMKGARLVKGEAGVTKINGEDVPTHFVTIANSDGTQTQMDVAKARYQMLDLSAQLGHVDRARQTNMQREHYAGQREDNKAIREQSAREAAAGRAIQLKQLRMQELQFNAATPLGQIEAKERALGTSLTADQKATLLGIDAMPTATRLQLSNLLKSQEQISQAINKAQADGSWQADSPGAKQLMSRSSMLSQQMTDLIGPNRRQNKDPAGILSGTDAQSPQQRGGVTTVPNPVAMDEQPGRPYVHEPAVLVPRGGISPTPAPQAQSVASILGLTADKSMNQVTTARASKIEAAAAAFKLSEQGFIGASKSGDATAIANYQNSMLKARQAVYDAIGPIPQPTQKAVLSAVGM